MSNYSLRQLNALVAELNSLVPSFHGNSFLVELNEFQPYEGQILDEKTSLLFNVEKFQNLVLAIANLRKIIGRANIDCGISDLLAQSSAIDKTISLYNLLASSEQVKDSVFIQGRLDKIKNSTEASNSWSNNSKFTTGLFEKEELNEFKSILLSLKKEKQKIKDQILELNLTQRAVIDSVTEEILKKYEIINK